MRHRVVGKHRVAERLPIVGREGRNLKIPVGVLIEGVCELRSRHVLGCPTLNFNGARVARGNPRSPGICVRVIVPWTVTSL